MGRRVEGAKNSRGLRTGSWSFAGSPANPVVVDRDARLSEVSGEIFPLKLALEENDAEVGFS